MAEHRTAWGQVKSGFRIASLIVLGFCFFIALSISLAHLTGQVGSSRARHPVLAVLSTVTLVVIMFTTTQYWARWIVGILALGVWRLFFALLLKFFYDLPVNLTLGEALMWFGYSIAALMLTMRHTRRSPRRAEKAGLVLFVIAAVLAMLHNSPVPLFYGLSLLAVAELGQRFVSHRRQRRRSQSQGLASSV